MTNRAIPLLALAALAACTGRRESPRPEPAQAPLDPLTRPSFRIIDDPNPQLKICVVRDGELALVEFDYDARSGDSLYQGVPLSQAFPLNDGYAAPAQWYVDNEAIRLLPGQAHAKYGHVRVLGVDELVRIGEYRGVGVYTQVGHADGPEVIYVPVRPGCVFQPYQINTK